MLYFVLFAAVLPLTVFAGGDYRAAVSHIESGGIGYQDGYTTLEMFFSSSPSSWKSVSFLDVKGHVFNDGNYAANAGIGFRALKKNRIYGINTYYDYRDESRLSSNQIGVGLESLGEVFDFRINGYLPIGKKSSSPYDTTFGSFSGNHLLLSQKYQSAMRGVNAECGLHLGRWRWFDVYAAAGPYYFIGEVARATWGGKASIAGTFKDMLTFEISDSYDRTFHNKFQAQVSLSFSFGHPCTRESACQPTLCHRMRQPVERQEIIVIDHARKNNAAINPLTGEPYFFVFVDNTSSSDGSYESPYHTLAQAQDNSSPNDIIYVFPGDGTTTGMDSGIFLKPNQKFWGSAMTHLLQTSQGVISIPAESTLAPTITNTNFDTEGNAITLSTHNAVSGFTITSALNDAIYGADSQSLDVSSCTITTANTYAIEASFLGNALVSLTNNQFLSNANGISLHLNGPSAFVCSNNTFTDQTSVSNTPIEVVASNNVFTGRIENNLFSNNTTGSIRFALDNVAAADVHVLNNTITNNGTGAQSTLGSNVVVIATGTIGNCKLALKNNTFSGNASNSLYLHTSGAYTNLDVTAAANTMLDNGGSGLVLATPADALTFVATDNSITGISDNGIAVISSGLTSTGTLTISNNIITDVGNTSNGIVINQDFSTLHLTLSNNEIDQCEGTGIISYAPTGVGAFTLNASENTISNCQNLSSNAASGLDIEQYTNLEATVTNNTLLDNTGLAVTIGSTLPTPTACLTLTGNAANTDYLLANPGDGVFNLSPCDVNSSNIGTINMSGTITPVQSCSDAIPCPP